MSLFSLSQDQQNILNALDQYTDQDTGEISSEYFSLLEETENQIVEKADNIGTLYAMLNSDISAIDNEIDRLKKLKESKEKRIDSLDKYILFVKEKFGLDRIDGRTHAFTFRKSVSTIIEDESKIPEQFQKIEIIPEQQVVKYPKADLKKAIESGEYVPWVLLQENILVKLS